MKRTIIDYLINHMLLHSDSVIAQIENKALYTYASFINCVKKHSCVLESKSLNRCKCAIICENEINAAISILSAWSVSMVPIPISPNYGCHHNKDIMELTQPDLIITDNLGIIGENNCLVYNINTFEFEEQKNNSNITESVLQDVALIMCTSGTTGKPKGIMITNEGLINNVKAIEAYFKITDNDRILIARPLYHCAVLTGEFLISLVKGLDIVFSNSHYSPQSVIEACRNYAITVLGGTPTLFRHISMLLKVKPSVLYLRVIAVSGECLTVSVAKIIRESFEDVKVYHVYGLTEASPRVSYLPPELFDVFPESVGFPLENTQVRILDKNGLELKANHHGYIVVKNTSIMKGYYQNPVLTANTIQNGWLYTGDIGYIDDNQKLFVLSRADDMIIKGGMNIYPSEIENRVLSSNVFNECRAYGYNNEDFTSIGIDVVLNKQYMNLTVKEIKAIMSSLLPQYQIPTKVQIVNCLKRTATGKIVRRNH